MRVHKNVKSEYLKTERKVLGSTFVHFCNNTNFDFNIGQWTSWILLVPLQLNDIILHNITYWIRMDSFQIRNNSKLENNEVGITNKEFWWTSTLRISLLLVWIPTKLVVILPQTQGIRWITTHYNDVLDLWYVVTIVLENFHCPVVYPDKDVIIIVVFELLASGTLLFA